MIHPPLRLYGEVLNASHELTLRLSDGTAAPLAIGRWLGPPDETDERLLTNARGPVLDVGCGPGRHLHALAKRGVFALGVDLSPIAVELARNRGVKAIVGSIFDEVPGAGTWRTALLLDGNIGIGGDPVRLLSRVHALVAADGEVLVELDALAATATTTTTTTAPLSARLETTSEVSGWFSWARVARGEIGDVARAAGFRTRSIWRSRGRWFARLQVPE